MKLSKLKDSKQIVILSIAIFFVGMLILNFLTVYVADDFAYMYSFSTGKRISSVFEIFDSLRVHSITMNGRLVAHFFAHLFLMFPKWIFDIINSGMFVLQIYLIYKICCHKTNNILLLWLIPALLFIFMPDFGQVYLWVDGACNYLWAIVFVLLFLVPLVRHFYGEKPYRNRVEQFFHICFAIPLGAYSESLSFGVILCSLLLLAVPFIHEKRKVEKSFIVSVLLLAVGYIIMMFTPATLANKTASGSLAIYLDNFMNVLISYKETVLILFAFWIVTFCIACFEKTNTKNRTLSFIFIFISLVLNFMHLTASTYPLRSMCGSIAFLVLAVLIVLNDVLKTKYVALFTSSVLVFMLIGAIDLCIASYDISNVYRQFRGREQYIYEEKAKGNLDLTLDLLHAETKYSAVYGLRDLSVDDASTWPNAYMSNYYEVNSIIGKTK